MKGKIILTVSQLNELLKNLIEEAFQEIYVEGEISNLRPYSSGHIYFSLKDEKSQIKSIMFRDYYNQLKFKLENGLKVICYGRIDYYLVRGEVNLVVYEITPKGIGELQLAFEQLKKKLEKEGLFDAKRKRPIPLLPQRIGIVTSPDGAAIRDILTVIRRRFANVEIILYPVKVQGETAKDEIVEGIRFLNENFPYLDVLLVGRGGGSIEDLWAFNEEIVARAIAASKIPVISCVGHEIDYTIADFVADLRAPTPSAAAEIVVKSKEELYHKIENLKIRLIQHIKQVIKFYSTKLKNLQENRVLRTPHIFYEDKIKEILDYENDILLHIKHYLDKMTNKINLYKEKILLLSPQNTLARGYAIVWHKGHILKDASILNEKDEVKVQLCKGSFVSTVKTIIKDG
ncbi:MAG: exodeoxyribonuclease VII large subunit [Elusimicrobiota bacterium]|nr:exodeoxyribonuclease VII large subunit [Endomicrobiia bacterium]MDW8166077.1 exodeoxyribonuclease VII large subunit [Elusimicrobiota bacterium]